MSQAARPLKAFSLAMINVAAICSIKNWPLTAEYGFASLFYFLVASLLFFFPVSFVSAELATGWPERGGVYVWVREAFGKRAGFLAAWLLWIENVVWYPTILSFIAGTIAFSFSPALAENRAYMFCVILGVFWAATAINSLGMKISGWISSMSVILGTVLPGALIIALGIFWVAEGNPAQVAFSIKSFLPNLNHPKQLSLLTGVLLGFAGMEMSTVHAREVENPRKNYPRAIFLSAIGILLFWALGSLAIAVVIPQKNINLVSGGMDAISHFLEAYKLKWSIPPISILIAIGALGGMSTWIVGPSKGLLAAAQDGDFPPTFHKINRKNMPVNILVAQGIIVSILSAIFLFMPNVNSSFWMLIALASQLYLILYILMFAAGIALRYKRPEVHRTYKIPGRNIGMWGMSGVGIGSALFAIAMGFFPPEQLEIGGLIVYELFLIFGILIFCTAPFLILFFKNPSWNEPIAFHDEG